ncbi:MAG: protein kinase, partial [Clostridiales bacterium]|nr:protein kinase [Clostridiales bacterium]
MAKLIKLPDNLKSWKVKSLVSKENGIELYKISKKDYDGTVINALLRHVCSYEEAYNEKNIEYLNEEAEFLQSVKDFGGNTNYIDVCAVNNESKEKFDLYIITEDLRTLADEIKDRNFSENEVLDFGIQVSGILEKLESKNIFHGNISPENIFIDKDGSYKLGGFSDFESKISDMSFVAPEIYNKKSTDFTTDIYSLGLIMYYLCNDKVLPFENENVDRESAVKERFEGKTVSAPKNGSEKLKSVIVIACQSKNENRWKNAGNINNALRSIKSEQPKEEKSGIPTAAAATAAVTAGAAFDGGAFDEYEYNGDDFEEILPDEPASE